MSEPQPDPEDTWAFTPEHRALLDKAQEDAREGRVRQMSEEELAAIEDRRPR